MVTDAQVRLLRKKMAEGKTIVTAAAAAGWRWTPPSEKESGVTLTTPITDGRANRSSIGGRSFDITGYFHRWGISSTTRDGARRGGSCAP